MIEEVVRQLGVRAVVQGGWLGLNIEGGDIITVKECPHDWLFRPDERLGPSRGPRNSRRGRVFGSTRCHCALALDQPFWSRRMRSLGLSPPGLDARNLTVPALTDSLREVFTEPSYRTHTGHVRQAQVGGRNRNRPGRDMAASVVMSVW